MNYNLNIQSYNDINRVTIINRIIEKNNYQSYLEIGVSTGESFLNVVCNKKVGVDPDKTSVATVFMTSDDFFVHIDDDEKFDIIFIDGLHEWHQCYRDIINAIRHLSPRGTIICHDMNPLIEQWVSNNSDNGIWTGDVYRSLIELRATRSDVESTLLYDSDMGIGIIRKKQLSNPPVNIENLNNLTFTEWERDKQYLSGCMPYIIFEQNFLDQDYFRHNFAEFV